MSVIDADRVMKLSLQYCVKGNRLSCNLYYGNDTVLGELSQELLAEEFATEVLPAWKGIVSNEVTFERVYVSSLVPGQSIPGEFFLQGELGTVVSPSLPSNIAAIFSVRQQDVASDHNGRFYVSGIPEGSVESSLITGVVASGTFVTLANALGLALTTGAGETARICCVQRFLDGAPVGPFAYTAAQIFGQRALGTQRRRTTEFRSWRP